MTSLGQSAGGWSPVSASLIWRLPLFFYWLCCYVSTKPRGKILLPTSDTCRNDVPFDQGVCLPGVRGCVCLLMWHILLAKLSRLCFVTVRQLLKFLQWLFMGRQPWLTLYLQKCRKFVISQWSSPCTGLVCCTWMDAIYRYVLF